MSTLVLFHAHCNDGFGAAWAARKVYGDEAEYQPVQYGDTPPDVTDRDVLMLDFAYRRPILEEMRAKARSFLILDHHETAQKDLAGLDYAIFDLSKSGATLTWEHFFPDQDVPWLLRYIEDRDLWRWTLPQSEEIAAALQSHPRTFEEWDDIVAAGFDSLVAEGIPILRYKKRLVVAAASRTRMISFAGFRVPCITSCILQSEIGGRLARRYPFVVIVFEVDRRRVYSLRSHAKKGLDVGSIARHFGGGGHRNASGFTVFLDDNGDPVDPEQCPLNAVYPGSPGAKKT